MMIDSKYDGASPFLVSKIVISIFCYSTNLLCNVSSLSVYAYLSVFAIIRKIYNLNILSTLRQHDG